MTALKKILSSLLALSLFSCNTGYKNSGDAVYYEHWSEASGQHSDKLDADPKTFRVLKFEAYAKDDRHVFFKGSKVKGADAATFEAIDDYFAKDKNCGWYGIDSVRTSKGLTFKMISPFYSTDGTDVFYTTEPLKMVEPKNFRFVYGENDNWTTDGKYYYYENYRIPSEDYNNLTIYPGSGGIAKDRDSIYFLDRTINYDLDGKRVIDTIDMATFTVTGYLECRDKYGCINPYRGRKVCDTL